MTSPAPPPVQPTLADDAVTLRPWTLADVEPARLRRDTELSRWFGWDDPVPTVAEQERAIGDRQAAYADDRRVVSFVVEVDGQVAGAVEVRRLAGRDLTGALSWVIFPRFRGQGRGAAALRLLIDYALGDLGLQRVEAHIDPANRSLLRTAGRAGLRKEGVLRGHGTVRGRRTDAVLLARLASDPGPYTREAFIATLNAGLPTKRAIAQGLIRNSRGEVLLCELVYKQFWDLPGGVVDPGESPAHAVLRELGEELKVAGRIRSLAAVSWLPPWRGWDDATLFVFDIEVDEAEVARAVLEPREIRAVHWVDEVTLKAQAADYTARLVERTIRQLTDGGGPVYLENGADPDW